MIPFSLPGCAIDHSRLIGTTLVVQAHTLTQAAPCPRCRQLSARGHSRYVRAPRDLPIQEQRVQLLLTVRRFFCDHASCPQRTFAERLPDLLPPHAQRTSRFTSALHQFGLALGGEAGTRLADRLRFRTSPDTLIRLVRQTAAPPSPTPRILGGRRFRTPKRSRVWHYPC